MNGTAADSGTSDDAHGTAAADAAGDTDLDPANASGDTVLDSANAAGDTVETVSGGADETEKNGETGKADGTTQTAGSDETDEASKTSAGNKADGTAETGTTNVKEDAGEATDFDSLLLSGNLAISEATRKFIADVEKVEFSSPELVWVGKVEKDTTVGALKDEHDLACEYSAELTEEEIAEINAQTVKAGDWVLISRKAFDTEESLTVTMKTGDVFTIYITDAMDISKPYDPGESFTAYDTRLDGFTINLFDYGPESSLDGGKNNLTDKGDGYYYGINSGHDLKFTAYGRKPSEEKTSNQTILTQNHFSGTDAATQGIVEKTLSGGYPKLAVGNKESLSYLFDTSSDGDNKKVYKDVYGLFQKDSDGKYGYDSDVNYAYYNPNQGNQGKFVLCDTFPEEGSSDSIGRWGVGFFPFDPWNGSKDCIHWNGYCPATGGNNSDRYYYNHHFGMTLEGKFQMTPDGKLNDHDMEFNFSGDDDLWVFVDDVLVMDIGGVHNPVGGSINFRTGEVTVKSAYQVNTVINDSVSGSAATTSIEQRFADAKKTWDSSAYSEHTIKVFYVERGGCYSNCRMEFNLTRFKDLEFDKMDQNGELVDGAEFRLYKENGEPLMETYIDHDDNDQVKTREYVATSDENGHVKFNNVPVGNYIIKETSVPDGYIEDKADLRGRVYVDKSEDGSTSIVKSELLRNGSTSDRAVNIKKKNITVTLEKQWKENGEPVAPPSGATASFNLVQVSTVTEKYTYTPAKQKATVRLLGANNQSLCDDLNVEVGDTIKIDGYQLSYFNNNYTWNPSDQVLLGENTIGTIQTWHNYGTVSNADPITYTLKESDVDSNGQVVLKLRSKNRENFDDTPDLSIQSKGLALEPVTESRVVEKSVAIESFSLPDGGWVKEFTVPLYNDDGNDCKYFFEEISNSANALITYVDGNGNTVSNPYNLRTNDDETKQTIINSVTTREIKATKQWDPETPPTNASITVELYKNGVATGDTVTLDGTVDENGEATAWIATFKVPEDGALYTVRESGIPSGYALVSVSSNGTGSAATVWIPVNGLSDRQQYLIVEGNKALHYHSGSFNVVSVSKTGAMITSADAACVFTMAADQGGFRIHPVSDLSITLGRNYTPWKYTEGQLKATDGNGEDSYLNLVDTSKLYSEIPASVELYTSVKVPTDGDIEYTIVNKKVEEPKTADVKIIKTDSTDGHAIEGAVFKLLCDYGYVKPTDGNGIKFSVSVNDDCSFAVPTDGVTITGLLEGSYIIEEISPPLGYVITDATTAFTVEADGSIAGKDVPAEGNPYEFEITNPLGAALPNTGGSGTHLFYLLGGILIVLTGVGLVMKRRGGNVA